MGRVRKFAFYVSMPLAAVFLAASVASLSWLDASASTEDDCLLDLGSWTPDPLTAFPEDFGTCTYSANSNMAISMCGADKEYSITFHTDESVTSLCTAVAPASPGGNSNSGTSGGCRSEVRGPLEQVVTLYLCHGRNGWATFPIGACYIKCTITATLPGAAARKKPSESFATIYIRNVAPGGQPGADSYTVCFSLNDLNLNPPVIFRFVSGGWVPVAVGNAASTRICATASGDGAFYLGEARES